MMWRQSALYRIPAQTQAPREAVRALPAATLEAMHDCKGTGYGSPCPPIARHRYFHRRSRARRHLP
jgi:phosphatidylethanolamine-binding protein (PEBP) family uncharacterized protein